MSASLVGSEMCIRDSARTCHGAARRRVRPANGQSRANCCALQGRRSPVSYTHLTLPTICSV
eukprot:10169835-Alexandrium_andersonii.AAC.1